MEDLASKLTQILNSKEGQEQLRNIQSMLGMNADAPPSTPSEGGQAQNGGGQGGFDLSALNAILSNLNASAQTPTDGAATPQPPAAGGGMPDLSGLAAAFSSNSGNGGPSSAGAENPLAGVDINMLMKLQQVFQSMNVNDKNTQLLLALKPHFSERRRARVDQAISMMRLFSMLPMLKESGLFAGL